MATSKKTTEETVVEPITPTDTDALQNGRAFWNKYGKILSAFLIGGLIGVIGFFAYKQFVSKPKETKANEMVFNAENLFSAMATSGFNKDSVNIVLNGGNVGGKNVTGLLKVINNYGGTKAGNRSKYMAGASYLNIGEFEKALKHLKDFDANGAAQVGIQSEILMGQAYAEQKKTEDALSHFKKAATVNVKDEQMSGNALFIAANYADHTGKTAEAKELFQKLKNDFPKHSSVLSGEIDKYLAKLGVFE